MPTDPTPQQPPYGENFDSVSQPVIPGVEGQRLGYGAPLSHPSTSPGSPPQRELGPGQLATYQQRMGFPHQAGGGLVPPLNNGAHPHYLGHNFAPSIPPSSPKSGSHALWIVGGIAGGLAIIAVGVLVVVLALAGNTRHELPQDFSTAEGPVASLDDFKLAVEQSMEGKAQCFTENEVSPDVAELMHVGEQRSGYASLIGVSQEQVGIYLCADYDLKNPPRDPDEWGSYLQAMYVEGASSEDALRVFRGMGEIMPRGAGVWYIRGENWALYSLGFSDDVKVACEEIFGHKVQQSVDMGAR